MLRRHFLAACASLVLLKNRVKDKLTGTISVYKNGKLIHRQENNIDNKRICYVEFEKPINIKSGESLEFTYTIKQDY